MAGNDEIKPESATKAVASKNSAVPVMEAPSPKDYYIIHNLSSQPIQIDKRDGGHSVTLGPKIEGKSLHISPPVYKKLLGKAVREMAKRGQILLIECDANGGTN